MIDLSRVTPAVFTPKVVHRLPGRLRLHLPILSRIEGATSLNQEDFCRFIANACGIRSVALSGHTGNVLVTYDPDRVSESQILSALRRLSLAAARVVPRLLMLSPERREKVGERIVAFLQRQPVDLRSTHPIEVPDDIWS
jgi:hypothetical protein